MLRIAILILGLLPAIGYANNMSRAMTAAELSILNTLLSLRDKADLKKSDLAIILGLERLSTKCEEEKNQIAPSVLHCASRFLLRNSDDIEIILVETFEIDDLARLNWKIYLNFKKNACIGIEDIKRFPEFAWMDKPSVCHAQLHNDHRNMSCDNPLPSYSFPKDKQARQRITIVERQRCADTIVFQYTTKVAK